MNNHYMFISMKLQCNLDEGEQDMHTKS